jgi:transcriptional regulator with XRE-family HTH domain
MKTHLTRYLRARRLELGLTQREVASALGYCPQFVTNWERGASQPPMGAIPGVCKALKIKRGVMLGLLEADASDSFRALLRGRG